MLNGGKGMNEVSIVWVDEQTGLKCKARLDRLTVYRGYPFVLDLKTSKDASPSPFSTTGELGGSLDAER